MFYKTKPSSQQSTVATVTTSSQNSDELSEFIFLFECFSHNSWSIVCEGQQTEMVYIKILSLSLSFSPIDRIAAVLHLFHWKNTRSKHSTASSRHATKIWRCRERFKLCSTKRCLAIIFTTVLEIKFLLNIFFFYLSKYFYEFIVLLYRLSEYFFVAVKK